MYFGRVTHFGGLGYNIHLLYVQFFKLDVILPINSLIYYIFATQSMIDLWTNNICGIWLEMQRLGLHTGLTESESEF